MVGQVGGEEEECDLKEKIMLKVLFKECNNIYVC